MNNQNANTTTPAKPVAATNGHAPDATPERSGTGTSGVHAGTPLRTRRSGAVRCGGG